MRERQGRRRKGGRREKEEEYGTERRRVDR